jgi:hypothetical protein
MRHPFDGIIIPDSSPDPSVSDRRSVLRWMGAAAAWLPAALFAWTRAAAEPPNAGNVDSAIATDPAKKRAKGYRLYFVAPRDIRRFGSARRKELGVDGKFVNGWRGSSELAETRGFLVWTRPEHAAGLRAESDVAKVHELKAEDTVVTGPPPLGPGEMVVALSPNGWREKPPGDTYLTAAELARKWSTDFARFGNLTFSPDATGRNVRIRVKHGQIPESVLAAIKADPQASYLVSTGGPTTRAVGEEGGHTPATTRAVGEEGGQYPTTYAVGEEGGMTTKAIGEEGGRPPQVTTYAVGEEGSRPPQVTTFAVGEEGAVQPPPRTTKALNEEAGFRPPVVRPPTSATTKALNEEAGTRPPSRVKNVQAVPRK